MSKRISCARVRRALQDRLDGIQGEAAGGPGGDSGNRDTLERPTALPAGVSAHLEACGRCAAFARSLDGLGAALRQALELRVATLPPPRIEEAAVRAAGKPAWGAGAGARAWERSRAHRGEGRAIGSRLRPWIALPVAAGLILAALSPALVRQAQTRRLLRREIASFVDQLYAEPFVAGLESGINGGPVGIELFYDSLAEMESWLAQ